MACNLPAGGQRRFAFEKYLPFQKGSWDAMKKEAADAVAMPQADQKPLLFGSDVAHRMVDFAERNAERAGVAQVIEFRGGDALQRLPPIDVSQYRRRRDAAQPTLRRAHRGGWGGSAQSVLAHASCHNWTTTANFSVSWPATGKKLRRLDAWMLTPDLKLPGKMRLKESRRVPMWNGPIECRMFRFDMMAGKMPGKTLRHAGADPGTTDNCAP
jgi:putative N6-adenine-specific DNA methylase